MRTIRFRGKRKDNGEWIYGSLVYDERGLPFIVGAVVESCEEYITLEVWCPVEKESVGQFTGLTDKNGKEIWEGDVAEIKNVVGGVIGRGHIVYDTDYAKFGLKLEKYHYPWTLCETKLIEVLGNVHEHGHLLK